MKLVPKLSFAFITGVSLVLMVNGYSRVQREVALFESDRIRYEEVIARTLGEALVTAWKEEGEAEALALVRRTDEGHTHVRVRWVWLDAAGLGSMSNELATLAALAPGTPHTVRGVDEDGVERRYTFVRATVPNARSGAVEVSEPLEAEHAYIRRTVLDTILTALAIDGFCLLIAMVLGAYFVGRPVAALMEKARRVGRGDFGDALRLAQRDELAELAAEMNAMCDQLVAANARVAAETQARITMLEQLRHADRLMTVGKLASGIAHELGTPLNVVEARASMIAGGETTAEESGEYARIIVRAAEQMTRILRQVLAFARPRVPDKTACDLAIIAHHTADLLKPLADKKRVEIRIAEDEGRVTAQADAGQIEQVMTNLVMNAVQAMDKAGTIDVCIDRARATPPPDVGGEEGEFARVRVRDQGRGIAKENIARVFEPFFTTKDIGEGTGLGLSITYGIVREHGGWIDVESEPGESTELRFFLPLPRERVRDARDRNEG